ncbi:MAG: Transcriptional regulator MraZ [Fimbriimonadales bacterium]|nr:MAG: hypothetical protein EDM73_01430 [Armatimonadota bacterium]MBV6502252.1 Transcriptional regulator MraZ [Fimbriimonadales bacterium]MCE7899089.1 hypothetical protein [Armatimonadetes bacterium ATM1]MDL1927544.1 hypothetical protein [Fimbriimonadia bacterium ATM]MBC6969821.1 hypothetical protein [Armatimonadota bacterium]
MQRELGALAKFGRPAGMDAEPASFGLRPQMNPFGLLEPADYDGPEILGTEDAVLDDKGRIRISKKKQTALGDEFVLWVWRDGAIVAYPKRVWKQMTRAARAQPAFSPEREYLLRTLGPNAEDGITCDSQGRFVIPIRLRREAKLDPGDVLLVGRVDRMEIWSKDKYKSFERELEAQVQQARTKAVASMTSE